MRWGPLSVRFAIWIVNLTILAIVVLSIMPLATGGLKISGPEDGMPQPTFEDGVLTISMPLEVSNSGPFDIVDLQVLISVSENGTLLAKSSTTPMEVLAGMDGELVPTFSFELNDLDQDKLATLIFNHAELEMGVEARGAYALSLISAQLVFEQTMAWEPLIDNLQLDQGTVEWNYNDKTLEMSVPYSFDVSSMIQGDALEMEMTLRNATETLGEMNETITLQAHNEDVLRMNLPPETAASLAGNPQELIIEVSITYMEVSMDQEQSYHWEGAA